MRLRGNDERALVSVLDAAWHRLDRCVRAGRFFIGQAANDAVAPPANAEVLKARFPERVEIAVIANAGHAILPEQPERLADLVIGALRRRPKSSCGGSGSLK